VVLKDVLQRRLQEDVHVKDPNLDQRRLQRRLLVNQDVVVPAK
jgi:hypothetical protein